MVDVLDSITQLRLARGWTQYELAKRSGLPRSTISTWYARNQMPTLWTLDRICRAFGITQSRLFREGEDAVVLTPDQRE